MGGTLTRDRSVRNPKYLTAGFKVKSKNKILKISSLVRIRLMGQLSRMRELSLVTTDIFWVGKKFGKLPHHPEFDRPVLLQQFS